MTFKRFSYVGALKEDVFVLNCVTLRVDATELVFLTNQFGLIK
jgi:hypothetical protein